MSAEKEVLEVPQLFYMYYSNSMQARGCLSFAHLCVVASFCYVVAVAEVTSLICGFGAVRRSADLGFRVPAGQVSTYSGRGCRPGLFYDDAPEGCVFGGTRMC